MTMQTAGKPPSVRIMENKICDLEDEIKRLRIALRDLTDAVASIAIFPMADEYKIAGPLERARAALTPNQ